MIGIQASVSKGWLHEKMGIAFDEAYYFDPLFRRDRDREIALLLEERFPVYRIHNLESNLVQLSHFSADLVFVGGIQPNLILGMLLGARFIPYKDQDADITETPLAGVDKISDLPVPVSLVETDLIRRWTRDIRDLQRSGEGTVIPPFFWDRSFRATIHGFITTALKFFGQDIFLSLYDHPRKVRDFFSWYLEACVVLVDHFSALTGSPPASLHVGECSGTMMGEEDYKDFLSPYLRAAAERIAPVRLHFCGNCNHLLAAVGETSGMTRLDTGSGTSVRLVRQILGRDFPLDLMPPVELLLTGGNPEDLLDWLDRVLEENAQGPLTLNYHLEPGYDEENHLLLHRELYRREILHPARG